ncbi:MAG: hypothetical protein QXX51_00645 [Candidatus Bathyarchaeia archaeon]
MFAMIFSFLMLPKVSPAYATDGAKVFVDPPNNIFDITQKTVNDTFTVSLTLANITGLAGFEFKLYWNSSILEGVNMTENLFKTVTPSGETGNIWQLMNEVAADHVWYAYTYQNLTRALERGYAPINITLAEGYPEGKLAAAIITLKILDKPAVLGTSLSCVLNITVSKPGDTSGKPIAHTVQHGYYELKFERETLYHIITIDSQNFTVVTESNATISPIMLYTRYRMLYFNATGADGATCFVNVTIPKDLLWLELPSDNWLVFVGGELVTPQVGGNTTHTWLYFTFTTSQRPIQIMGTSVVPEFPILMLPLILISAALLLRFRTKLRISAPQKN